VGELRPPGKPSGASLAEFTSQPLVLLGAKFPLVPFGLALAPQPGGLAEHPLLLLSALHRVKQPSAALGG
jgi:hypothetical protein